MNGSLMCPVRLVNSNVETNNHNDGQSTCAKANYTKVQCAQKIFIQESEETATDPNIKFGDNDSNLGKKNVKNGFTNKNSSLDSANKSVSLVNSTSESREKHQLVVNYIFQNINYSYSIIQIMFNIFYDILKFLAVSPQYNSSVISSMHLLCYNSHYNYILKILYILT